MTEGGWEGRTAEGFWGAECDFGKLGGGTEHSTAWVALWVGLCTQQCIGV